MLRKSSIAAAAIAFATAGSALFSGAALAQDITNTGGAGGPGGAATNDRCVNVAAGIPVVPILSNVSNTASCNAVGGAGGAGGGASIDH